MCLSLPSPIYIHIDFLSFDPNSVLVALCLFIFFFCLVHGIRWQTFFRYWFLPCILKLSACDLIKLFQLLCCLYRCSRRRKQAQHHASWRETFTNISNAWVSSLSKFINLPLPGFPGTFNTSYLSHAYLLYHFLCWDVNGWNFPSGKVFNQNNQKIVSYLPTLKWAMAVWKK